MKLLSVSPDAKLRLEIDEEARHQGWALRQVEDRSQVLEAVNQFGPHMLVIDLTDISDLDWWSRQEVIQSKPLIFLIPEVNEEFLTRAFECGVDGLVPKPYFSRRLLAARVKAYLRRQGLADSRRFVPRLNLVLDSQRYKIEINSTPVSLTLTEFKIVRELATDTEKVVSRREIQAQVFGSQQVSKRSLDVHVCSLRKKLSPFRLGIDSVRGVGYRLNPCAS